MKYKQHGNKYIYILNLKRLNKLLFGFFSKAPSIGNKAVGVIPCELYVRTGYSFYAHFDLFDGNRLYVILDEDIFNKKQRKYIIDNNEDIVVCVDQNKGIGILTQKYVW